MDITVKGTGYQDNIEAQVDGTHQSLRANIRPLEHIINGVVGGHFQMAATYSNTAAKPAAGSDVFSLRWFATNMLFVLKHLSVWVTTTTTYTATLCQDLALYKATGFTVAASAGTQVIPSASSQKARTGNMAGSLLGGGGGVLWVSSGDLLTVGTRTLDTQPFGYFAYQNPITTPGLPQYGVLEEVRDFGEHPEILAANEGFVVQTPIGNAQAAGVSKYAFVMEWAEVPAY